MADTNIYVIHADMTQLGASALAFSTSDRFDGGGQMYSAFAAGVPGFQDGYRQLQREHAGAPVGSAFWIPVEGCTSIEGVVAVVTVPHRREMFEATRRSVEGALRCAHLHTDPTDGKRPLIALPAFHAGHGGGHRALLAMAEAQIETAARVARERCLDRYDIAFCTYTQALHHIYLRARQRVLGRAAAFAEPPAELASAIRNREAVLFVGSGMSSSAGLPSWSALIDRLAKDLGIVAQPGSDLEYFLDLAQWHRESGAGASLEEIAAELFDSRRGLRPTLSHYLALALPFRHIITTNYDALIEQTLEGLRRRHVCVVDQEHVARTGRSDCCSIVKLHGDAATGANIVLSRDDYDTFFTRRPAMAVLLEGLLLNHTFLFIGYGLRDPNFRQIYSRIAVMLAEAKRPAYAITFDGNPHQSAQWANKGLHLIQVPGDDRVEQQTNLRRWLDRLAEATIGAPRVFLTPDAGGDSSLLEPLRDNLRRVGAEVEALCNSESLSATEAAIAADVLVFLLGMGWRPPNNRPLSRMLELVADRLDDPERRRRLLGLALEHTAKLTDAIALFGKLDD